MKTHVCWVGIAVALWALVGLAAAPGHTRPPEVQAQKVPDSLVDVGEFGENIYDFAKAKEWAKAVEKLDALKGAVKKLAGDLKDGKAAVKRLEEPLAALGKAVPAKDQLAAMRGANQVTLIAADLIEPFNPQVPAAITRLDCYGRELEIGTAAKDKNQLKAAADNLRKTWDKIRPAVKGKGGEAEAKRFDALMTKIGAAKTVEDYGMLATPILDEVDNLEKVFKK